MASLDACACRDGITHPHCPVHDRDGKRREEYRCTCGKWTFSAACPLAEHREASSRPQHRGHFY
jgi:hypothetical protein